MRLNTPHWFPGFPPHPSWRGEGAKNIPQSRKTNRGTTFKTNREAAKITRAQALLLVASRLRLCVRLIPQPTMGQQKMAGGRAGLGVNVRAAGSDGARH